MLSFIQQHAAELPLESLDLFIAGYTMLDAISREIIKKVG